MKVLMFGWEFPPHISGGLGTACFGLTNGLAQHGVEVKFVVPKAWGDEDQSRVKLINASDVVLDFRQTASKEFWENISFVEVGTNLIPYASPEEFYTIMEKKQKTGEQVQESIYSQKYQFSGKYGNNLLEEVNRYAIVATSIAKNQDFDLIHAHDWLTYPAGIAARAASGKPLVIHIHATEFDRSGEQNLNRAVYDLEMQGFQAADRIIAVSNLTKNTLVTRYGIPADKIEVVHNAVIPVEKSDVEAKKHFREKVVTFLGRVTFQKGPDYFVEAAYKVLQKDDNVRFVMAGSGDMLRKIIRRVAELRIADRFHFTGFLRGEDVDRMFAMSDVYVMPSVSEPFGISPLEAMRSNVPVIISRQSGVAEILKHAITVDFWDIDAMADSIHGLLHYDALSRMFIRHGKSEVDNLKWENAAFKVKKVYEQFLNS